MIIDLRVFLYERVMLTSNASMQYVANARKDKFTRSLCVEGTCSEQLDVDSDAVKWRLWHVYRELISIECNVVELEASVTGQLIHGLAVVIGEQQHIVYSDANWGFNPGECDREQCEEKVREGLEEVRARRRHGSRRDRL